MEAGNSKICRADIQFESKSWQAEEFSLTRGRVSLFFYTGLQLIGQGPPTLRRAIWFAQFTNLSVKLIQNVLTETPRIMFD